MFIVNLDFFNVTISRLVIISHYNPRIGITNDKNIVNGYIMSNCYQAFATVLLSIILLSVSVMVYVPISSSSSSIVIRSMLLLLFSFVVTVSYYMIHYLLVFVYISLNLASVPP